MRIGATTISAGKRGYETPAGVFTILQKDKDHYSKKYHHAPMPYDLRLTGEASRFTEAMCQAIPRPMAASVFPSPSPGRCSTRPDWAWR